MPIGSSLDYACWKVISKYRDPRTEKVDGFRFNKMMSLLNTKLLDGGKDIHLPRCWYLYGEQLVSAELPSSVRLDGQSDAEAKTTVTWAGEAPERPAAKDKRKIDSTVDYLYSRFPPTGSIHDAVAEVYSHAPYEFQRAYAAFRSDFSLRSQVDMDGSLRAKLFYPTEFEKALRLFPADDIPELRVPAKKVELVGKALLKAHPGENKTVVKMAIAFWEVFCKILRTKRGVGYHYVSVERVAHWREVAEDAVAMYLKELQSQIDEVVPKLNVDEVKDPFVLAFLRPEVLGKGFADLSTRVDEIVYG